MNGHEFDCASNIGGPCTCGDNDPRSDLERKIVAIGNIIGLFFLFSVMILAEKCG